MKIFILIFAFVCFLSCTSNGVREMTADLPGIIHPTPTSTVEPNKVPFEFSTTDFRNFTYPFGKLVDGKIDGRTGDPLEWSLNYSLDTVGYGDLAGSPEKEAIVLVNMLGCGASCNGGSTLIFFYGIYKNKPKLIGRIETGSRADGCSIKSLVVENKKITLEQFGHCKEDVSNASNDTTNKFTIADITKNVFAFERDKLVRVSSEIDQTGTFSALNYSSTITIR